MFKFRDILVTLICGIMAGATFAYIMDREQVQEGMDHTNDLIDYLIGEWTGTSTGDTISISDQDVAQVAARKELPTARLGYFPDTVRALATMVQDRYAVPAAVTMAQWALESQWGKKNLGASNYFGHTYAATKSFVDTPKYVLRRELINVAGSNISGLPVKFASYKSIAECFDAHGKYLSQSRLYHAAFLTKNAEQFARAIAVHYATDPDYSIKLITIMRRYKL